MQVFFPTTKTGRIAKGSTPYGTFLVEWDEAGNEIQNRITPRDPGNGTPPPQGERLYTKPPPDAPRRIAPPGDWIKAAVYTVTLGLARHCLSCGQRREALNKAGWLGLPGLVWRQIRNKSK